MASCGKVSEALSALAYVRGTTTLTLLQRLQLLAGFETHRFAGWNGDLGAGARVAADPGLAWADVEDAEAAQLDALTVRQSPLHALKNCFHSHLGLGLGDAGFVDHFVDDVELDHGLPLCSPQGGSKPHDRIGVRDLSSEALLESIEQIPILADQRETVSSVCNKRLRFDRFELIPKMLSIPGMYGSGSCSTKAKVLTNVSISPRPA